QTDAHLRRSAPPRYNPHCMFKRLRQLEISLAAKCQMLFGAAVILIIAAALYVPWQRMEQLIEQMNERTGKTLADWAEADHLARQIEARPSGGPPPPATGPTTAPIGTSQEKAVVRMFLLNNLPRGLSRFETKALDTFREDPDAQTIVKRQTNKEGP